MYLVSARDLAAVDGPHLIVGEIPGDHVLCVVELTLGGVPGQHVETVRAGRPVPSEGVLEQPVAALTRESLRVRVGDVPPAVLQARSLVEVPVSGVVVVAEERPVAEVVPQVQVGRHASEHAARLHIVVDVVPGGQGVVGAGHPVAQGVDAVLAPLQVVALAVVDAGEGRRHHGRVDEARRPAEVGRVGRFAVVVGVGRVDVHVQLEPVGRIQGQVGTQREPLEVGALDDPRLVHVGPGDEIGEVLGASPDRRIVVLQDRLLQDGAHPVGIGAVPVHIGFRDQLRSARAVLGAAGVVVRIVGRIVVGARRICGIPALEVGVVPRSLHVLDVLGGIHQTRLVERGLQTAVCPEAHLRRHAALSPLRGDQNDAVGATRAVDGRGCRVLQDLDGFNIVGVEVGQRVGARHAETGPLQTHVALDGQVHRVGHAVDDVEGLGARGNRAPAPHQDLGGGSRLPRRLGHVDPRQPPLERGLQVGCHGSPSDVNARDRRHGSRHFPSQLRSVPDDDQLVQTEHGPGENHVQHHRLFGRDRDLPALGRETEILVEDDLRAGGQVDQQVPALLVREAPDSRPFDGHLHGGERLSCFRRGDGAGDLTLQRERGRNHPDEQTDQDSYPHSHISSMRQGATHAPGLDQQSSNLSPDAQRGIYHRTPGAAPGTPPKEASRPGGRSPGTFRAPASS